MPKVPFGREMKNEENPPCNTENCSLALTTSYVNAK